MDIYEIARTRGVTQSTIETHLVRFISSGQIQLTDLVAEEKIEPIRRAIMKFSDIGALSPVKESLGANFSYGEIRAVLATM